MLGKEPVGTMPHALTIVMGGPREAFRALQKHLEKRVPRIALVDTYYDEKTESIIAAEEIDDLEGVRLDTPSERGGVTVDLVKEVRARLDGAGFGHVGIFVSGGLDANRIREFEAAKSPIHSYGVGMAISSAPPIAFTAVT